MASIKNTSTNWVDIGKDFNWFKILDAQQRWQVKADDVIGNWKSSQANSAGKNIVSEWPTIVDSNMIQAGKQIAPHSSNTQWKIIGDWNGGSYLTQEQKAAAAQQAKNRIPTVRNWWAAKSTTTAKNTGTPNNKENLEKVDVVGGEVVNPKTGWDKVKTTLKNAGKGAAALLWLWTAAYLMWWGNSGNGSTDTSSNGGNWGNGGNSGNSGSGTTVNRNPITATDYPEIVRQVIRGEFGNGQARKNALAQAGYDYNEVQSLVNDAMARKPYNGNQITQPQVQQQAVSNPLSSSNNYANYDEYRNTLINSQQNGYIDPNGQWHTGMSQNDFNQSYISGQQDIFDSRRNEVMANGETADQAFWRILNDANQNPGSYDENKMNTLRQMAQMLGYMDEAGNFADNSGYAINMSFANPMNADEFNSVHAPQTAADQAVQANNYKNSINNASRNNNYPNGHWMMSSDLANTQGANAQEYNKRFFL